MWKHSHCQGYVKSPFNALPWVASVIRDPCKSSTPWTICKDDSPPRTDRVPNALARQAAVALTGPRQVGKNDPGPVGEAQESFYLAVGDLKPDCQSLVNSGSERYPMREGLEAIGLAEMAAVLGNL